MKLIILDRDGVINHDSPDYIKHPDEWVAIPGSLHAIARLYQAGYTVAVASNQSGLARGLFDITALTSIHQKLRKELAQLAGAIDAFFVCPHGPDEHCLCRDAARVTRADIYRPATTAHVAWARRARGQHADRLRRAGHAPAVRVRLRLAAGDGGRATCVRGGQQPRIRAPGRHQH